MKPCHISNETSNSTTIELALQNSDQWLFLLVLPIFIHLSSRAILFQANALSNKAGTPESTTALQMVLVQHPSSSAQLTHCTGDREHKHSIPNTFRPASFSSL